MELQNSKRDFEILSQEFVDAPDSAGMRCKILVHNQTITILPTIPPDTGQETDSSPHFPTRPHRHITKDGHSIEVTAERQIRDRQFRDTLPVHVPSIQWTANPTVQDFKQISMILSLHPYMTILPPV